MCPNPLQRSAGRTGGKQACWLIEKTWGLVLLGPVPHHVNSDPGPPPKDASNAPDGAQPSLRHWRLKVAGGAAAVQQHDFTLLRPLAFPCRPSVKMLRGGGVGRVHPLAPLGPFTLPPYTVNVWASPGAPPPGAPPRPAHLHCRVAGHRAPGAQMSVSPRVRASVPLGGLS